jgi:4-alpha-glucanotransferase
MEFPRSSGILLHPTSLPGPHGIGDVGPEALRWLEWLHAHGQRVWQVLPLGPTGYGDSPYQSFSAFAGNPWLVSPAALADDGLLAADDLARPPDDPGGRVPYGAVIPWKNHVLDRAWQRFRDSPPLALAAAFDAFRTRAAAWLDDFALFMALKDEAGGTPWTRWDRPLARREPAALEAARARLAGPIGAQRFRQFAFFRQWDAVRARAHALGIRVIGDVPIFVAHDSADVWAHPGLFELDNDGLPTVVAGVPPDYFSATGQRWGNPLYRWSAHASDGYAWWIARLRAALDQVDLVRLDHFRGFAAHWEVPAAAETAERGCWVPGPGAALFDAVRAALGALPLIAEDLGVITPDVAALRDRFGLPGMKVLQFAFGDGASNPFLPHNHARAAIVYTGTHDNAPTRAWYEHEATSAQRDHLRTYLRTDGADVAWDLIHAASASVADTSVVPLQDVLALGEDGRMNRPGRADGNWSWRFRWEDLRPETGARLLEVTTLYGR